jgi:acid phosphatase type 7
VLKRFLRDGHSRPPVLSVQRAYSAGRIGRAGEAPARRYLAALVLAPALVLGSAAASRPLQAPGPVVLAAGDIASCGLPGDERTAALLDANRGTVLTLGDNAYEDGSPTEFQACYGPTWGRHKRRIRPAPGNHDYNTASASGYFRYFGKAAGPNPRGYYSFDLGDWHIVSLNSERDTAADGAQVRWLKRDLASSKSACVLAYWHRPRWSAGKYGDDASTAPFWSVLYDYRADVVLAGHDHNYQRYRRMNKLGAPDGRRGIRSFVVGTGGAFPHSLRPDPRRQAAKAGTWGILRLTLHPGRYAWRFLPVAGGRYSDAGSGKCSPA